MKDKPSQVILGLVDGVEVLRYLAASPVPVTGSSIAKELGLSPVRVSRILTTLSWMGVAHRDKSRKYSPGPGLHVLATQNLAASGLLHRIIKHLKRMSDCPYVLATGVLWRDQVTFLYYQSPDATTTETLKQWVRPATISSIGMALLACQADEQILTLYGERNDIPGLYRTTSELMHAINEIRENGYAALRWDTHTSIAVTVGYPPYTAIAISGFKGVNEELHYLDVLNEVVADVVNEPLQRQDGDKKGGICYEASENDSSLSTEIYI